MLEIRELRSSWTLSLLSSFFSSSSLSSFSKSSFSTEMSTRSISRVSKDANDRRKGVNKSGLKTPVNSIWQQDKFCLKTGSRTMFVNPKYLRFGNFHDR
ncbi:hypothetical protein DFH11DRAFT_1610881 [Phellopilus nigrolimitatus]|nr:hypothetical protein DFH11DRAFT_1610881 [Phellopilus nigrolimitatus]